MIYDITLKIDYDYDAPSDHSRNLLRLLPSDIPGAQRVISRLMTLDPMPDERRDCLDFFGNATTSVAWHAPLAAVSILVRARVDRQTPRPEMDFSTSLAGLARDLAQHQSLASDAPHHFLGASPRVPPDPAMTAFARDLLQPGMSTLQAVEAVGRALHREMRFDAEATTVDTPPREAFDKRHGVCQDFAQVMIGCLRGIGVPAGYVSGFLRTFPPPGQPRLEGADAMHAWVRAWVGAERGWIEFDPTNDQFAGVDYITVAQGRDYADVAPVRGTMRSAGGHDTHQAVDVVPLGPTV